MLKPEFEPKTVATEIKDLEANLIQSGKNIENKLKEINELEAKIAEQEFRLADDNPKKLSESELQALKDQVSILIKEKNDLEAQEDALLADKRKILN